MYNYKQKARARRTKNKLRLTSSFGKPFGQRIKHARKEYRRQARTSVPITSSVGCNRFLALRFEAIPYLEIKPQNHGDAGDLKAMIEETMGPILNISEASDIRYLAAFGGKMNELVKGTEADWCVAEINDSEPVIVISYNHGGLGGWLAPRLAFLPELKRRSDRLHNAVLNSFRHMRQEFSMTDITDWYFINDWVDQRLEEDEFETAEERRHFEQTFLKYEQGVAKDYFKLVTHPPAIQIDECLKQCNKRVPEDLKPLMKAVTEVLELMKEGDAPINYDIGQAGGFGSGVECYCDNGELSIDMQYGWRWDDDPIGAMACEYIEDIGNNCGVQPMVSWMTIGNGFTYPKTKEELRQKMMDLSKGKFPEKFNRVLDNLCYEIDQAFPSKYQQ